jgi:hypothetical protein
MRRGRCRCGKILHFHMTPRGYKMRCPRCLAIVRLRVDKPPPPAPPPAPPPPASRPDSSTLPFPGKGG